MRDAVFIGDDITALGFRLAGVETHTPDPDEVAALVGGLRETTQVIVMTPEMFAALPPRLAQELSDSEAPLLSIVADARATRPVPDIERDVKRVLGIET